MVALMMVIAWVGLVLDLVPQMGLGVPGMNSLMVSALALVNTEAGFPPRLSRRHPSRQMCPSPVGRGVLALELPWP